MPEKMSKNFSREEFACQGVGCCGHSAPISSKLVDAVQKLRNIVGMPLRINSGFRCKTHNAKVGGVIDSPHCKGIAADVATPRGMTDVEFYNIACNIEEFKNGGVGIYDGRIHVDVRDADKGGVRWDKRSTK